MDDEYRPRRRRPAHCQCDGATVGPCPGPLNCPYSGLGPEDQPEGENMARQDISYDFEDFVMTAQQLREKYGAAGHPEHTKAGWKFDVENDNTLSGYWDWVLDHIEEDDDVIQGAGEGA
jgi:hypothetical protein